jgi:hypothetical protein
MFDSNHVQNDFIYQTGGSILLFLPSKNLCYMNSYLHHSRAVKCCSVIVMIVLYWDADVIFVLCHYWIRQNDKTRSLTSMFFSLVITSIMLSCTYGKIDLLSLYWLLWGFLCSVLSLICWFPFSCCFTGSHGCIQSTSCWWAWFDGESPSVHDEVLSGKFKRHLWLLQDIRIFTWWIPKMNILYSILKSNINFRFNTREMHMVLFAGCAWAEVEVTSGFVWRFRKSCPPAYVYFIR